MLPGIVMPAGLARKLSSGPSWVTTFSKSLTIDNNGWSGFNQRQLLNSSLLSVSGTSLTRITLQADSSVGCSIDGCFIGHQAAGASPDPYDFDGGQVRVTFSVGSHSVTIGAGSQVVSDAISFVLDHTKNLIIASHFPSTSSIKIAGLTGATSYEHSAADETGTSVVSMGLDGSSRVALVNKIEVQ